MIEKKEIWKEIQGHPNYSISDMGRIKANDRIDSSGRKYKSRLLSPLSCNGHYPYIKLFTNGKIVKQYIHRLVISAFVPNPDNKPSINHINGIKYDNRLENLEWATWSENISHAHKTGLLKLPKGGNHPNHKKLGQYDKENNLIKIWDGVRHCARELGFGCNRIYPILNGYRKHFRGYKWAIIETTSETE